MDDCLWWEWPEHRFKAFFGCQKEFDYTQKYARIEHFKWGIPTIFICNNLPFLSDWQKSFMDINTIVVEIKNNLY